MIDGKNNVLQKLRQEELSVLSNMLAPLTVEKGVRNPSVQLILNADDLDRRKADIDYESIVTEALISPSSEKIATVCKGIQESQRIRRDTAVARAGHKRLMTASVRTAYNKQTQLEYLLNGAKNTVEKDT